MQELIEAEAVFAAHLDEFYAHAFAGFYVIDDGTGAERGAGRDLNDDFNWGTGGGGFERFQKEAAESDGAETGGATLVTGAPDDD